MRTGWANTPFFAKIRKIVICRINLPKFGQILGYFGEAPICFIPNSYLSLPMFFNSFNVMAKSKSFFGLRTGSTKSLTFQVFRGQQITKDRVYRVSNPRSEAQMTQRALIPIVAAARSQLKGLVDHSFEGIAYGENSLREFSAMNLRAGALEVTSYSPNGVSNAGFANLLVSKGTLNGDFSRSNTTETYTIFQLNSTNVPIMAFPAAEAGSSATPIFNYLEEYGKANNVAVFAPGTQLTFLTIYEAGTAKVKTATGTKDASLAGFAIDRIMIPNSESSNTELTDVNGAWKVKDAITADAKTVTLVNNDGDEITIDYSEAGSVSFLKLQISASVAASKNANCGGALILSRFVNGTWKRNTARINIGFEPKNKYTFEDWLSVYQTTGSASKKYLNAGDETTGIQG